MMTPIPPFLINPPVSGNATAAPLPSNAPALSSDFFARVLASSSEVSSFKKNPHDPVGIVNRGVDCWAISALQIILNSKELTFVFKYILERMIDDLRKKLMADGKSPDLAANGIEHQLLSAFENLQREREDPSCRVSTFDISLLSTFLAKMEPFVFPSPTSAPQQQDAREGLTFLLNPPEILTTQNGETVSGYLLGEKKEVITHSATRALVSTDPKTPLERPRSNHSTALETADCSYVREEQPSNQVALTFPPSGDSFSFLSLVAEEFRDRERSFYAYRLPTLPPSELDPTLLPPAPLDPDAGKEFLYTARWRPRFVSPPSSLIVDCNRFTQNLITTATGEPGVVSNKNNAKILNVPLEFPFNEEWSATRTTPIFQLKSFCVHIGDSLSAGHYITYVESDGRWLCLNDHRVSEVTDLAELQRILNSETVYFYYYLNKSKEWDEENFLRCYPKETTTIASVSTLQSLARPSPNVSASSFTELAAHESTTEEDLKVLWQTLQMLYSDHLYKLRANYREAYDFVKTWLNDVIIPDMKSKGIKISILPHQALAYFLIQDCKEKGCTLPEWVDKHLEDNASLIETTQKLLPFEWEYFLGSQSIANTFLRDLAATHLPSDPSKQRTLLMNYIFANILLLFRKYRQDFSGSIASFEHILFTRERYANILFRTLSSAASSTAKRKLHQVTDPGLPPNKRSRVENISLPDIDLSAVDVTDLTPDKEGLESLSLLIFAALECDPFLLRINSESSLYDWLEIPSVGLYSSLSPEVQAAFSCKDLIWAVIALIKSSSQDLDDPTNPFVALPSPPLTKWDSGK